MRPSYKRRERPIRTAARLEIVRLRPGRARRADAPTPRLRSTQTGRTIIIGTVASADRHNRDNAASSASTTAPLSPHRVWVDYNGSRRAKGSSKASVPPYRRADLDRVFQTGRKPESSHLPNLPPGGPIFAPFHLTSPDHSSFPWPVSATVRWEPG